VTTYDVAMQHRWTTAEWDRLLDGSGLEGMPVELVDGAIVDMTPQGEEHAGVILALQRLLWPAGPSLLNIQMPLALADGWMPEPDVMLTERSGRAHPTRADLVVEVMVTAHAEARRKLPGYLAGDVGQVWLVDVPARAVEVHPGGELRRGVDVLDAGVARFTVDELFATAHL
jgi:Uma2 family endonuclease